MSRWRREAVERLPQLRHLVASREIDNPMMLWIELNLKFEKLCERDPLPVDLLKDIWSYCQWSLQSRSGNVRTGAAYGFCEHLLDTPARRKILPRLMTRSDFENLESLLIAWNGDEAYQFALQEIWP